MTSKETNNQKAPSFSDWEVGPRYTIKSILGEGSFGQVALAYDNQVMRKVAIKRVREIFRDRNESKRALRELMILRKLDHPSLTMLYDVLIPGEDFQDIYFVMNHFLTDLNGIIMSYTHLNINQVNSVTYDLIGALKYLNSAKVFHRDLKPGNILVNSKGAVTICDFGLARFLEPKSEEFQKRKLKNKKTLFLPDEASLRSRQEIPHKKEVPVKRRARSLERIVPKEKKRSLSPHMVTRWYRAPEIILMEEEYDNKVDMWSLGCVYAELLDLIPGNCPNPMDRMPLFPGSSCFPFTKKGKRIQIQKDKAGNGETDQLALICSVLGKPSEKSSGFISNNLAYNYLRSLPKQQGIDLAQRFPAASKESIDFLKKCLVFNPQNRISLEQAINHPVFANYRNKILEEFKMEPCDWSWESRSDKMSQEEFRALIIKERQGFLDEFESKFYY